MPTNLGNSSVATRLEKVSFHSNPKEGQCQRMFKLPHNCSHFTFQQSSSQNSPSQAPTVPKPELDVQLHLEKAEEPETKLPTSTGSSKKQENSRRTSTFASLTVLKPLTVWITKKLWKLTSRDEITRTAYLPPEKPFCRSRSNSQNWTWNNELLPNWERSTSRLYIVTLLI